MRERDLFAIMRKRGGSGGSTGGASVETVPLTLDCTVDEHSFCQVSYVGIDENGNVAGIAKEITSGTMVIDVLDFTTLFVEAWNNKSTGDWVTSVFTLDGSDFPCYLYGSREIEIFYIAKMEDYPNPKIILNIESINISDW